MPPFKADSHVAVEASSSSDQAAPAFGTKATPAQLEVDYDVDMTNVYKAITSEDWDGALAALRAEPSEARRAPPGLLLPFESDVWGFTPDPPKAPPRKPAPRTATILARMGGASEVYREAQLRHVAARKAAPSAARNEPDPADAYDPRGIDV